MTRRITSEGRITFRENVKVISDALNRIENDKKLVEEMITELHEVLGLKKEDIRALACLVQNEIMEIDDVESKRISLV